MASQQISFTANEPTTNADGTPLADLAKLRLYWKHDGGAETAIDYPASRPQGGGTLTNSFTVPFTTGVISSTMAARDLSGLESARSNVASLTLGGSPPATVPAPVVTALCDHRIRAIAPDTTGGWSGQLKDGTTNLSTPGASPLQRDVALAAGVHTITVVWTKTGVPARTSAVTTVTCP